jgi:hypothetical protein
MTEMDSTVVTEHGEIVPLPPTASSGSMTAVVGGHLEQYKTFSHTLAQSGLVPDAIRGKPADVFLIIMAGLDLGLRPMQALQGIYVVKGRPSLSAEMMRGLLARDGHGFGVVVLTENECTVKGRRAGETEWHEASFTIAQATRAKLLSNSNWQTYPEDMLLARATARLCRRFFPDVIGGLQAAEDLLDLAQAEQPTGTMAAQAARLVPVLTSVPDPAATAARIAELNAQHAQPTAAPADTRTAEQIAWETPADQDDTVSETPEVQQIRQNLDRLTDETEAGNATEPDGPEMEDPPADPWADTPPAAQPGSKGQRS